jgi:selenocysteine lyase/cysteine desulfurase
MTSFPTKYSSSPAKKDLAFNLVRIKNAPGGGVDLEDLALQLKKLKPRLLAITHIPTNSGLVQPVQESGEIYGQYQRRQGDGTWYILDACESIGQNEPGCNRTAM